MAAQEVMAGFLNAIPSAAASPLALIAYLAALAAWVAIVFNTRRLTILMKDIRRLPEPDRIVAIREVLGRVHIPKGVTGAQFLTQRKHTYVFWGFIALCGVIVLVIGMSFYRFYERRAVADAMIIDILGSSSSAPTASRSNFMSAVNVLSNGPAMVEQAGAQIQPPMSSSELKAKSDELQLQHLSSAQILQRLADAAGTGQLQDVNRVLSAAAKQIEDQFHDLANCYRAANCGKGTQFKRLCKMVATNHRNIVMVNRNAQSIPGVNFNASGTGTMLSSGALDIHFDEVSSDAIAYLAVEVCGDIS